MSNDNGDVDATPSHYDFKPLRRFPKVLLVVTLSSYLRFDKSGVDILGSVPLSSSHHFFQSPFHGTLRFLKRTTSTAILISVIGFLDSIVAAKQGASRFGYSVSPNRELVALGAGNLAASFVPGTLSAYGSITRTKINGDCGARTQLSSIICASIILFATFSLLGRIIRMRLSWGMRNASGRGKRGRKRRRRRL